VERIGGRGLESGVDALVEGCSFRCFGMNQQRSDADAVGDRRDLKEGVPNERRANAPSLFPEIHAESSEDHDGHGMVTNALGQSGWRISMFDRARRQRVVAHDRPGTGAAHDVDLGGIRLLGL